MKKRIVITLILAIVLGSTLLYSGGITINPTIAEMSWEDGYQTVYLLAGTYHFEWHCYVSTTVPYDDTNIWLNSAYVTGVSIQDPGYSGASWPIANTHCVKNSASFTITTAGDYSMRAGTYACYGCVVHSNNAKLIRTALLSNY